MIKLLLNASQVGHLASFMARQLARPDNTVLSPGHPNLWPGTVSPIWWNKTMIFIKRERWFLLLDVVFPFIVQIMQLLPGINNVSWRALLDAGLRSPDSLNVHQLTLAPAFSQ